jgi:hypothetical protein
MRILEGPALHRNKPILLYTEPILGAHLGRRAAVSGLLKSAARPRHNKQPQTTTTSACYLAFLIRTTRGRFQAINCTSNPPGPVIVNAIRNDTREPNVSPVQTSSPTFSLCT